MDNYIEFVQSLENIQQVNWWTASWIPRSQDEKEVARQQWLETRKLQPGDIKIAA